MKERTNSLHAGRLVEVAVESVEAAVCAERAGADRVELGAALALGGLTPSLGAVEQARARLELPLAVLVRPRAGDFVYSEEEHAAQCADVERVRDAGADVIVVGCLTPTGALDAERTAELVERARPAAVTFHRAFDHCSDRSAALERLCELGVERILSSGGAPSALEGLEQLVALERQARGRIGLVVGGGVRAAAVPRLLASLPGAELHASCASGSDSASRGPGLGAGGATSGGRVTLDLELLRALLQAARAR